MDQLLVDIYAGDGRFAIEKLVAAGAPWVGVMGKATQGNYYCDRDWLAWFMGERRKTDRWGVDWFSTLYHYFDAGIEGDVQADFYLKAIDATGGWGAGDMWAVIDVERAGQRAHPSSAQVEDRVSAWVAKVQQATGKPVVLYGGEFVRSLGITSRMGCEYCWVAAYTRTLPPTYYTRMGFDLDHLLAWQGIGKNGDGTVSGSWEGYPTTTPGGDADLSALVLGGGGTSAVDRVSKEACTTAPG